MSGLRTTACDQSGQGLSLHLHLRVTTKNYLPWSVPSCSTTFTLDQQSIHVGKTSAKSRPARRLELGAFPKHTHKIDCRKSTTPEINEQIRGAVSKKPEQTEGMLELALPCLTPLRSRVKTAPICRRPHPEPSAHTIPPRPAAYLPPSAPATMQAVRPRTWGTHNGTSHAATHDRGPNPEGSGSGVAWHNDSQPCSPTKFRRVVVIIRSLLTVPGLALHQKAVPQSQACALLSAGSMALIREAARVKTQNRGRLLCTPRQPCVYVRHMTCA